MRIGRNLTRYNTEDLQALLAEVCPFGTQEISVDYGKPVQQRRRRYYSWGRQSSDCHREFARFNGSVLRIAPISYIAERLTPAQALVFEGTQRLPSFVLEDVIQALRSHFGARSKGVEAASVRIERNVQTPREQRKLTKKERIEALRDQYGQGGKLEGSSRTHEYLWRSKVDEASSYYVREWERRDAWRKKLLAVGEEPPQHETWAEYLRRKADEWDAEQERRAAWSAGRRA